jgi:hypothetical protein
MKMLRPSTIITAGPLLLGGATALAASLAMPHSHDLPGFAWLFAIGAALGLAIFGPIAAIFAIGERHPEWLRLHSWRIDFYSSAAGLLSIGYLGACMYHSISDKFMLPALSLVFLGATIKTALSYALRRQNSHGIR